MSGYANIFDTEEIAEIELSPEEAIAGIGMVAAFADQEGSEIEAAGLAGFLSNEELYQDYELEEIEEMLNTLAEIAAQSGLGVLLNTSLEYLTEDLIPTAFAIATALLVIDGEIPDPEAEFLAHLQDSLDLSDEEASAIIDGVLAGMEEAMAEE